MHRFFSYIVLLTASLPLHAHGSHTPHTHSGSGFFESLLHSISNPGTYLPLLAILIAGLFILRLKNQSSSK